MLLLASLLAAASFLALTPLRRAIPVESLLGFMAAAGVLVVLFLTGRLA